jgi:hypothetical protein
MWLAVSVLLNYVGGWYRLGKLYQVPPFKTPDQSRWFASGRVGLCHYKACLNVGVDSGGLYLSVAPPFNFMTPRLYIPWNALHLISNSTRRWFPAISYRDDSGQMIKLYGGSARLAYEASTLDIDARQRNTLG